jgi:hypothetical protein
MTGEERERALVVLRMIPEDMEADTHRREGQPFNGQTLGAALAEVSATIAALAKIVALMLEDGYG